MLQLCAKSVLNGTAPAAPPSKLRNDLPSTAIVGGTVDDRRRVQPVAQQRGRADDLERRAGRIAALQRAVEVVRGPVGDREHVAGRRLDHDQRALLDAVQSAARRRSGRRGRAACAATGRACRACGRASSPRRPCRGSGSARAASGVPASRSSYSRSSPDWPATSPVGQAPARLLDLLGGHRPDRAEQRPRERAATGRARPWCGSARRPGPRSARPRPWRTRPRAA